MRALLLLGVLTLAGCAGGPQPVDHPCGVITDSLQSVNATTRSGNERLAVHFERGASAGCWKRVGSFPSARHVWKAHPHVQKAKPMPEPVFVEPEPRPAPVVESTPAPPAPPPPDPSFMDKVRDHLHAGIQW